MIGGIYRMIKILVVITTGMSPYGGLTTVAMNYYRKMDLKKNKMDFVSSNILDTELENEINKNGSRYYKLPSRNKSLFQYFIALKKIAKDYDIIHIHANSATATIELLAARLAGVPRRIIHIHNTTCTHMKIHKTLKPLFDRCYTDAIACSKAAGDWIFPAGSYKVLNNSIDLERYAYSIQNRENIRRKYGLKENDYVIGHVGKLVKQKNHTFLLDVFKMVLKKQPYSYLLLVGDGELREELEEKAKKLDIIDNVIFCGMQNDASIFLSAFDVIIFPSLWEGLPLSLLEAQANGLDSIASDNITSEVDFGGVQQVSLSEDTSVWADLTLQINCNNRKVKSERYRKIMVERGYDIRSNVMALEKIYMHA